MDSDNERIEDDYDEEEIIDLGDDILPFSMSFKPIKVEVK